MAIDRDKVLAAAQKYVEKKKYDRAVVEYQRIIQEDPNDARTLLKIGDLQSKMEAYADAVGTYERVGKFYASQGFSLKAIAVYKQIREIIAKHVPQLEDKYAHITPKLAELYQQLGLTSDALAALDEVATRHQRQNRDQDAIEVFRKIVELDPTNPLPHLRLAEAMWHAKDVDGAVSEFGMAAAQLGKLGRRDDAIKVFERLLHLKPDPTYARLAAEQYLARNAVNDGVQALARLQVCFQANPRDLDTLTLLARAFNQIGQASKGIEVQKEMARIARDTGKTDLFKELVTKLQKLAPNDEGVRQLALGSQPPIVSVASVASVPPGQSILPDDVDPEPEVEPESLSTIEATDAEDDDAYVDVADGDIEPDADEAPARRSRRPTAADPYETEHEAETATLAVVDEAPPQSLPSRDALSRVLTDAATFRRARLHTKAIDKLRLGLQIDPRSIDVHTALRDVLLDVGQTDEAISVMIALAGLQIDGLDGDAAARTLQDLLALDPGNARGAEMLRGLGYELVEDGEPASSTTQTGYELAPMRPQYASSSYDPEAPLPSYDLEEIGPEDVARRSYSEPSIRTVTAVQPAPQLEGIDDPFGDGPLPSFPLDGAPDSEAAAFDLVARGEGHEEAPTRGPSAGAPELESALEEAEFFTSRGLYDDARTILQEQLSRLPNHPLLLERLAEVDAQERGAAQVGSGTRPSPAAAQEDRSFDIAESLNVLDSLEQAGEPGAPAFGAATDQVDVEEVFAKFKEGVAKQIGVDDAQSHYDLGVAYKEMGLLDDAMREFDTAARDPKRSCICHSMIGMIQLERGNLNEAIDAFIRGLQAPDRTKDQEASLAYEVGAAYEVKKMSKQAVDYFQRAARLIPTFRDVQERIRRLSKSEPKQPIRAFAVGADDDFDRAFDDILGSGKLP